jgi:hypothetical protein
VESTTLPSPPLHLQSPPPPHPPPPPPTNPPSPTNIPHHHPTLSNPNQVFNFLHRLVRVSKVREVLEAARRPEGMEQGPPVAYPRSVQIQT